MAVRMTIERVEDLQNLCTEAYFTETISIRNLTKIIGKMVTS